MIILFIKGLYQSVQIRLTLFLFGLLTPQKNQNQLVKKKLLSKKFNWRKNTQTKVFAIFSISNWENAFLDPLSEFGELHHFSWPNAKEFFPGTKEWRVYYDQINTDLITSFNKLYDTTSNILIFIYASDFSISEATMQYLNKYNVLIVSFCWDDLLYFKGNVRGQPVGVSNLSRYADINLTMSPEAIPRYNFKGSPCFFWRSERVPGTKTDIHIKTAIDMPFYVLFIGSKYGWRTRFIEKLVWAGMPVKCYGAGWENGQLSHKEMKIAIGKAPVTLGFANVGYTRNVTTLKGRDFEVPLYGGLYLTQYSEGLLRYYQPGKEVLTYRNFSECLVQLKQIQANREIADGIRAAGYQKASVYGSWQSRFAYLHQLIYQTVE